VKRKTTAHQVNIVVIVVKVVLANVLDRVLESRVKRIPTADQMNLVVDLTEHALQNVLENSVPLLDTAHQVKSVVALGKTLLANVLDLVLENRVTMIPNADHQVYIVVVQIKHVP
jgi:hypothetical protein